jgi:hypothetical protein
MCRIRFSVTVVIVVLSMICARRPAAIAGSCPDAGDPRLARRRDLDVEVSKCLARCLELWKKDSNAYAPCMAQGCDALKRELAALNAELPRDRPECRVPRVEEKGHSTSTAHADSAPGELDRDLHKALELAVKAGTGNVEEAIARIQRATPKTLGGLPDMRTRGGKEIADLQKTVGVLKGLEKSLTYGPDAVKGVFGSEEERRRALEDAQAKGVSDAAQYALEKAVERALGEAGLFVLRRASLYGGVLLDPVPTGVEPGDIVRDDLAVIMDPLGRRPHEGGVFADTPSVQDVLARKGKALTEMEAVYAKYSEREITYPRSDLEKARAKVQEEEDRYWREMDNGQRPHGPVIDTRRAESPGAPPAQAGGEIRPWIETVPASRNTLP